MITKVKSIARYVIVLLMMTMSCKKDDPKVTPVINPPTGTKSAAKDITKYTFAALSPAVDATIDATAKSISATVPTGTDVTKLVPTITLSDKATVSPATGVAQDFTKEVSYTVTAEDGSTAVWKVNVVVLVPVAGTSGGTWTQKSNFPNDSISSGKPISMVFGDKVIIGFGAKFSNPNLSTSIWEYNLTTDKWLKKANFPGEARFGVSSFVINGKGYVVGGSTKLFAKTFKELWEYDPSSDKWTKKTDYPDVSFVYGVSEVANNKAYLGTGFQTYNSNWYEYDPATDKWTKKSNLSSSRGFGTSFTINNKIYVGTGSNSSNTYQKDFYEYDPAANTWKQVADLIGKARDFAFGFSINGKGYVCGGSFHDNGGSFDDVYEYDPSTNKWVQKTPIKSSIRSSGTSFVFGNKAYLGLGLSANSDYLKELWTVEF